VPVFFPSSLLRVSAISIRLPFEPASVSLGFLNDRQLFLPPGNPAQKSQADCIGCHVVITSLVNFLPSLVKPSIDFFISISFFRDSSSLMHNLWRKEVTPGQFPSWRSIRFVIFKGSSDIKKHLSQNQATGSSNLPSVHALLRVLLMPRERRWILLDETT
jgi:hypothetical protein